VEKELRNGALQVTYPSRHYDRVSNFALPTTTTSE